MFNVRLRVGSSVMSQERGAAGEHAAILEVIGTQVRTQRHGRGFSQSELALRSGLTVETISKIENRREWPSLTSLVRLASALEVGLPELVTGAPTPEPKEPSNAHSRYARQLLELLPHLDAKVVKQLLALVRLLAKSEVESR